MATRVLVSSPLHNLGATVVSTMYAHGATFSGKTSMLLATEVNTPIPDYLGLEGVNDPTRSVMQISKLVDAGSISDIDILDYAHQYSKNAYYINMADRSLEGVERMQVLKHLFARSPVDIVVCDNGFDIDSTETETLLEEADAYFIVIDMSAKALAYLENWAYSSTLNKYPNTFVVINHYDETVASMRDFARKTPYTYNRLCKLHYNPWIRKCCFNGQLQTILPLSKQADPRVCNLSADVLDFVKCCASIELLKTKKGF